MGVLKQSILAEYHLTGTQRHGLDVAIPQDARRFLQFLSEFRGAGSAAAD